MRGIVTTGSIMTGQVGHHADHIVGYDTWEDDQGNQHAEAIYCAGHPVEGLQGAGLARVRIEGEVVAIVGDEGTSDCACDGDGFINQSGSPTVRINGKGIVRVGDVVDIHGQGTGTLISGSGKVRVR